MGIRTIAVAISLLALTASGCEKKGGAGKERGACYGNGTCDPGLTCMSDLCVRPPPADCAKVAEKLAGYRLGNYAPKEERAAVVGELTEACESARLSVDEGKCILEAESRMDIAQCPRPLLKELSGKGGDCKAVGENFARLFISEMADTATPEARARAGETLSRAIAASCMEDAWPDSGKTCVGAAVTMKDMSDCADAFPEDFEDVLEKRLGPVIEQVMGELMGGGSGGFAPPPPPPQPPATQPSTPTTPPPAVAPEAPAK